MQVLKNGWFLLTCLIILITANIFMYQTIFAHGKLVATIREAGKGTVVLVRDPARHTLLVNTGSDASILRVLGEELPPWQQSIDTVILTDPTVSDAGGFQDVMSRYHVATVIRSAMQGSPSMESSLSTAIHLEKGLQERSVPFGAELLFNHAVRVVVLSPHVVIISYGMSSLTVSSTTPLGVYSLNGETVTKND